MKDKNEKTVRNLIIFSLIVVFLPWVGVFLDQGGGMAPSEGLGILLWMAAPLLATIILRAFFGSGWKDFGIKPNFKGNDLWYLVSLLFYPIITLIVVLVSQWTGIVSVTGFNWGRFAASMLAALPFAFIKNLFVEEAAWRGFLAPKMNKVAKNRLVSHLLVGFIWGLWHLPYVFIFTEQSNLGAFTTQSPTEVALFYIIGAMGSAIVYGEIRNRVNSFWPAVLMHTVGSVISVPLVMEGWLKMTPGMEWLATPGATGLLSIFLAVIFGVYLFLKVPKEA